MNEKQAQQMHERLNKLDTDNKSLRKENDTLKRAAQILEAKLKKIDKKAERAQHVASTATKRVAALEALLRKTL